jgi:lipopolysaccharide/colanic/teichoic acid biosynthesis glycosyltransferase
MGIQSEQLGVRRAEQELGTVASTDSLSREAPHGVPGHALPVETQRDEAGIVGPRERSLDLISALAGIALVSPLMILIGVAIKLTSPGPVLVRHNRIGPDRRNLRLAPPRPDRRRQDRGGRPFTTYKFRTVSIMGGTLGGWGARRRELGVTRLGRILRAYRLDELPQLLSVLAGDLSLVGARPAREPTREARDDLALTVSGASLTAVTGPQRGGH